MGLWLFCSFFDDFVSVSCWLNTDVLEDTFDTSSICVGEIETSAPFQLLLQMDDMSVEELETMVQERYKTSSGLVTYAEDVYKTKQSFELDTELSSFESAIPSSQDPIIWKVKCRVMWLLLWYHFVKFGVTSYYFVHCSWLSILFSVAGWARESFSRLPYAKVRWSSALGKNSKDNFCICSWPCKGLSFHWSLQAMWSLWGLRANIVLMNYCLLLSLD